LDLPDLYPLTTKGDLMVADNTGTDDRLPVFTPGDDGKVLTVNGDATFGVGWEDYPSFVAPVTDKRQLLTFRHIFINPPGFIIGTIAADTPAGSIRSDGRYLVSTSSLSGLGWTDTDAPIFSLATDDTLLVGDSIGDGSVLAAGLGDDFLVADSSAPLGVRWDSGTINSGAPVLIDLVADFDQTDMAKDIVTTPGTITWQRCCGRDVNNLNNLLNTWSVELGSLSGILTTTGDDGIFRGAFNPLKNGLFVVETNIKWNPPVQIPTPGILARLCILAEFHTQWSTIADVKNQYFPLGSNLAKVNNEETYAEATSLSPSNAFGYTAMCSMRTIIFVDDFTTFDTLYLRCFGKNETVALGFHDDMMTGSTMRIMYYSDP
jgi:hypothetical protein